jgi:hypothetical protein
MQGASLVLMFCFGFCDAFVQNVEQEGFVVMSVKFRNLIISVQYWSHRSSCVSDGLEPAMEWTLSVKVIAKVVLRKEVEFSVEGVI